MRTGSAATLVAALLAVSAGACGRPAEDTGPHDVEEVVPWRSEGPPVIVEPSLDDFDTGGCLPAAPDTSEFVTLVAPAPPVVRKPMESVAGRPDWLARHQSPDGRWDRDGFDAQCEGPRCDGLGAPREDPAADQDAGSTGLALLTYLAMGETHRTPRHGQTVRFGLKYLKEIQAEDGFFGRPGPQRVLQDHVLATLAMTEAYGLTMSPLFKSSAWNGVRHLEQRVDERLGWAHAAMPDDEALRLNLLGVMALKSAAISGLSVDAAAMVTMRAWFRSESLRDLGPGDGRTAALTLGRVLSGEKALDESTRAALGRLVAQPLPSDVRDLEMGAFDTWAAVLATWHAGDREWRWGRRLATLVLRGGDDDTEGCDHGSRVAVGVSALDGGRLDSTALFLLATGPLYVYRRVVPGDR